MSNRTLGKCLLTGSRGKFVKSHIIPKALTRLDIKGAPFLQGGSGIKLTRRYDSWYDQSIVTRKGEDILEKIDSFGIDFLRSQKLVWSGWGPRQDVFDCTDRIEGSPYGVRLVHCTAPVELRRFFLSILWRSAVSSLFEMSEVTISESNIKKISDFIQGGDAPPVDFFPISLTQISTMGKRHNQTPFRFMKKVPAVDGRAPKEFEAFRFYFDGLIVHIHNYSSDDGYSKEIESILVGNSSVFYIPTIEYNASFQKENFHLIVRSTVYHGVKPSTDPANGA